MQFVSVPDYASLSRTGADYVASVIAAKPDAALVVATGDTPMGVYHELAERYRCGKLDTSRLRIFQLDDYLGLAADDRRSLYGWLDRAFLAPLGIGPEQVVRLPGNAGDPEAVCRDYDAAVAAAGGFDLAILGLGPNGHLGFNEPPSEPSSPTRVVALSACSIASNARYWGGQEAVPRYALTAGMQVLLGAKQTLLLVAGSAKATILRRVLREPIDAALPASLLRTIPGVTVLADRDAWEMYDA